MKSMCRSWVKLRLKQNLQLQQIRANVHVMKDVVQKKQHSRGRGRFSGPPRSPQTHPENLWSYVGGQPAACGAPFIISNNKILLH